MDTVYFFHLRPDAVHLYERALKTLNVNLVPIYKGGRSSVYTGYAKSLVAAYGGVVPGLLDTYPPPDAGSIILVSYSAGYGAVREALKDDPPLVDGVVSIDSWYADKDPDGTASDEDLEGIVDFARLARCSLKTLWIGHSDIEISSYASTEKVAEEIIRLAGPPAYGFHVQRFDVAKSEGAEHARALTDWGPPFLARAIRTLRKLRSTEYDY